MQCLGLSISHSNEILVITSLFFTNYNVYQALKLVSSALLSFGRNQNWIKFHFLCSFFVLWFSNMRWFSVKLASAVFFKNILKFFIQKAEKLQIWKDGDKQENQVENGSHTSATESGDHSAAATAQWLWMRQSLSVAGISAAFHARQKLNLGNKTDFAANILFLQMFC